MSKPQRLQPQNIDAEASILGACLSDERSVNVALKEVAVDDFYVPVNRVIFQAITDLSQSGRPVDLVTVFQRIKETGKGEIVSASGLSALTEMIPYWKATEGHCRIVKDLARARRAIALANAMADQCYQGLPIRDILDDVSVELAMIAGADYGQPETYAEILPRVMDKIEQVSFRGVSYGISTGFMDIDRRLGGFVAKDLVVLAARPSMGKTALALDFGNNVAAQGHPVLVFSLEMGKEQLAARSISSKSSVSGDAIRKGFVNDHSWPKLVKAQENLGKLPLTIIDNPSLGIGEIRSMAKMQHLRKPLGLVIVDYLQLSNAAAGKGANREREIAMISSGLKGLAKELNCPVLALSQLNRGVDGRTDKRPVLSDLRESGAIEQDADVVMFIYRDEVYNPDPLNPHRGIAEIITAKQRNGPIGVDKLLFQGEFSRFLNFSLEDPNNHNGGENGQGHESAS